MYFPMYIHFVRAFHGRLLKKNGLINLSISLSQLGNPWTILIMNSTIHLTFIKASSRLGLNISSTNISYTGELNTYGSTISAVL